MKFFLDTADIAEIKTGISWGVVDGVTTNPSLYAKVGGSYEELLKEICGLTKGPVSAEVIADDADGMVAEGRAFAKIASNIVVKVPMTTEGLTAISRFRAEGIKTNCTLIFTANQGLMAAKAGASLISPFVGRLDDIGATGMSLIREIVDVFDNFDYATEVLVASVRNPIHVIEAARMDGCGELGIYARVAVPLLGPEFGTLGLITFIDSWNNFIGPLIVMRSSENYTFPLALRSIQSPVDTEWGALMAGSAVAVFPLLLIFVFSSRRLIEGLTAGAVKS